MTAASAELWMRSEAIDGKKTRMAGHRRAEATPSFRRPCPAMTMRAGRPDTSMQKQSVFHAPLLAGFLLVPQVSIVLIFFYWPAAQAVWQSFLLQDAFGLSITFIWFENYVDLLGQPEYFNAIARTFAFSAAIAGSSLSFALLLAVMADKPIRGAGIYRTLLIWPYAVAPAVGGVLWIFMLHPSLGVLARGLRNIGVDW